MRIQAFKSKSRLLHGYGSASRTAASFARRKQSSRRPSQSSTAQDGRPSDWQARSPTQGRGKTPQTNSVRLVPRSQARARPEQHGGQPQAVNGAPRLERAAVTRWRGSAWRAEEAPERTRREETDPGGGPQERQRARAREGQVRGKARETGEEEESDKRKKEEERVPYSRGSARQNRGGPKRTTEQGREKEDDHARKRPEKARAQVRETQERIKEMKRERRDDEEEEEEEEDEMREAPPSGKDRRGNDRGRQERARERACEREDVQYTKVRERERAQVRARQERIKEREREE